MSVLFTLRHRKLRTKDPGKFSWIFCYRTEPSAEQKLVQNTWLTSGCSAGVKMAGFDFDKCM